MPYQPPKPWGDPLGPRQYLQTAVLAPRLSGAGMCEEGAGPPRIGRPRCSPTPLGHLPLPGPPALT